MRSIIWRIVRIERQNGQQGVPVLKTVYIAVAGFCAGWSSELCIVFVFLQGLFILYAYCIRKERQPLWYFAGIIAMVAGWLLLYTCPGTAGRIKGIVAAGLDYRSLSEILRMPPRIFIQTVIHTYTRVLRWLYYESYVSFSALLLLSSFFYKPDVKKLLSSFFVVILGGVCLFMLPKFFFLPYMTVAAGFYAYKFRHENKELSGLFTIAAGVLFVEFVFIGATIQFAIPRRAGFQYTVLNFILIALVMRYCFDTFAGAFKIKMCACICCAVLNLAAVALVSFECYRMYTKWQAMLESIEAQKRSGRRDIVVDKEIFKSRYWGYGDWGNPGENTADWANVRYAQYFHVETFIAK